ncbi:uncharacterized protein CCOS01_06344 [Colletotrichum costaricense]|uniref:Uncharacterized protein n=1 Tax=Colletotrichum costaricense TaxID=1209916 RepID=A0AAJ0E248_9PEZI|nr:uncharacterized protein CCOS01_06344 [Colletotrichum costaricense]KAK1528510.1 hypothetical protein CCOS01_06344 [Colletotrichum costaricense]
MPMLHRDDAPVARPVDRAGLLRAQSCALSPVRSHVRRRETCRREWVTALASPHVSFCYNPRAYRSFLYGRYNSTTCLRPACHFFLS